MAAGATRARMDSFSTLSDNDHESRNEVCPLYIVLLLLRSVPTVSMFVIVRTYNGWMFSRGLRLLAIR